MGEIEIRGYIVELDDKKAEINKKTRRISQNYHSNFKLFRRPKLH